MAKKNAGVPADVFVTTVMQVHSEGGNWDEVAKRLGVKKTSCTVRASNLRKEALAKGVELNLPTLSRCGRGRKKDIAALAKMVSDFQAVQAVTPTTEVAEVAEVSQVVEVTPVSEVVEVSPVSETLPIVE